MKARFPLLVNENVVIHHKDHNPKKNRFSNLTIMEKGNHTRHHISKTIDETLKTAFKDLDKVLERYNWNLD